MHRLFSCQSCSFQIRRFAAAMPPERCPHCHSSDIVEVVPGAPRVEPSAQDLAPEAFACERGEVCTRLRGGECPGGKGC